MCTYYTCIFGLLFSTALFKHSSVIFICWSSRADTSDNCSLTSFSISIFSSDLEPVAEEEKRSGYITLCCFWFIPVPFEFVPAADGSGCGALYPTSSSITFSASYNSRRKAKHLNKMANIYSCMHALGNTFEHIFSVFFTFIILVRDARVS